ncbi:MAG: DUF2341 domain-containing protein [bacterium]|nr:DUF2341 domain-containing protein [bacterium]
MFTRAIGCFLLFICFSAGAMTINSGSDAAFESVTPRPRGDPWWDDAWNHRARVFIDNHYSNELLINFPIPLTVVYRGSMQTDFDDIRFTDMDGNPLLYWIEDLKQSSSAEFWIRVPEIPNATNIYIYYGNHDASSESNVDGYAELYEPFDDDPTRSGGWSVYRHAGESYLEGCWDPADEVFYLTRQECDLGTAIFADLDMTRLNGWVLTFDYLVGGGTGAEGFCAMFYKDEAPYADGTPSCGRGLGFTTADGDAIPGYGIEFDAHPGEGDSNRRHVALIEDSTDNRLTTIEDDRVCDRIWHHVELVRLGGKLTLKLDSDILFYEHTFNTPDGDGDHGGLGFCASTGDLTNDHIIDNVLLRKWTNPMPYSMVGDEESPDVTIIETSFGQIKALFQ